MFVFADFVPSFRSSIAWHTMYIFFGIALNCIYQLDRLLCASEESRVTIAGGSTPVLALDEI